MDSKVHECSWQENVELNREVDGYYGHAICNIAKFWGNWIAENGEYATKIRYCPFCGEWLWTCNG